VKVWADESCLGNGRDGDNPGGAGGLIEYRHPVSGSVSRFDYWLSEPATTNNRMALRSAIEAMKILSAKEKRLEVEFTSDSQYLVKGMKEWLPGWKARGWKRKEGEIVNLSLWKELDVAASAHRVIWQWVRGHNQHPENEYADHLATRAAREQANSGGPVPSLYEAWRKMDGVRRKLANHTVGESDG
jgi:ribonuclease HI